MEEPAKKGSGASKVPGSQGKGRVPVQSQSGVKEPNEAFFGSLLIFSLALSLVATMGYFGVTGYRYFKAVAHEQSIPSIEALPADSKDTMAESSEAENPKPTTAETSVAAPDKKTIEIKVLNGGTTKGVAGTYAEKLKGLGFTKATTGNSFGSHTGATLYTAKGQEASRDFLKETILKDYPALVMKEAVTGDKDMTAAPLVLILGR
jgi:hypothetical protein